MSPTNTSSEDLSRYSSRALSVEMSTFSDIEPQSVYPGGADSDDLIPALEQFLSTLGLDTEDLRLAGCDISKLNRLYQIEIHPILGRFPWLKIDFLFERILMYPFLDAAGITQPDSEKSFKPGARLWLHGRGMPFKSRRTLGKAVASVFFRAGFEMSLLGILDVGLASLLIYQLAHDENVLKALFSNDQSTVRNLIFLAAGKYGAVAKNCVIPLLLFPVFWGGCLAAWNAERQMNQCHQPEIRRLLRKTQKYPVGLWHDLFRWLLPRPPLNEQFNQLQSFIRWNGNINTPQEREDLFQALTAHAAKRRGYSRIVLYWKIAELAQSPAFSQFHLLKDAFTKEEIASLLKIKSRAFGFIIQKRNTAWAELLQKPGIQNSVYFIYLHYLQWALGDTKAKVKSTDLLFVAYKISKLGLSSFILVRLIQALIAYMNCPDEPLDFNHGIPSVNHLLSLACFNETIKQFATIPGEPITELTDKLGSFKLSGDIAIDLSNKELLTHQVITFLEQFAQKQKDAKITTLNLANNIINNYDLIPKLMSVMPDVETLNFDHNNLAITKDTSSQFALGLKLLPNLKKLTLSNNRLGQWDTSPAEMLYFLNSLTMDHPKLEYLDLSSNYIGGLIARDIQEIKNRVKGLAEQLQTGQTSQIAFLNLENNLFDLGTSLSSYILSFIIRPLDKLQQLNLSNNFLGLHNSDGVAALGNSLVHKKALSSLLLDNNFIELIDSKGLQAIGKSLKTFSSLNITSIAFNMLGKHDPAGLVTLFEGLSAHPQLESLSLRMNYIDLTDDQASLSLSNAMTSWQRLKTLDISMNELGRLDSKGVNAFAASFIHLKKLTTLLLENNRINVKTFEDFRAWQTLGTLNKLTNLNLAANQFGLNSTLGGQVIGQSIKEMAHLNTLDLSHNAIGSFGDEGIHAIANGIQGKHALTNFTIQPQEGHFNLGGIENDPAKLLNDIAINQLPDKKPLRLITPDAVENYLNSLPTSTTELDLSRLVYEPSQLICLRMMRTIRHRFPNLTSFIFTNNNLGFNPYALRAFAIELSYLTSLEHLDLSNNFISTHQLHEMGGLLTIALKDLINLKTLNLSKNFFGYLGFAEKPLGAALLSLEKLETLDLSDNMLGFKHDRGLEAIGFGLFGTKRLTELDVSQNWIGTNGFRGLQTMAEGLALLSRLRTIHFSSNLLGSATSKGLPKFSFPPGYPKGNLSTLLYAGLSDCQIGMQGKTGVEDYVQAFAYAKNLKTLDLSNNYIGFTNTETTRTFAEALKATLSLQTLLLGNNPLGYHGNDGVIALSDAIKNQVHLTELDLSDNSANALGIGFFVNSLHQLKSLRTLVLNRTPLGINMQSSIDLGQILPQLTELVSLNLQYTAIGSQSAGAFAALTSGLAVLSQLQTLSLDNAYIGSQGNTDLINLSHALKNMTALKYFQLLPQYTYTTKPTDTYTQITFDDTLIHTVNLALQSTNTTLPITQALTTSERVKNYLSFFPKSTHSFVFSNFFDATTPANTLTSLMNGLSEFKSLTSLDLSNNDFGHNLPAAQALGDGFRFILQLESLFLTNNTLGALDDSSASLFAQGLAKLQNLKTLSLAQNYFNSSDSSPNSVIDTLSIQGLKHLINLEVLDLSASSASASLGTSGLSTALVKMKNLRELYLGSNAIGNFLSPGYTENSQRLMKAIATLKHLTKLNLQGNSIDSAGSVLADSLKTLVTLTHLDLSQNNIQSSQCETVGESLGSLVELEVLNLGLNEWGGGELKIANRQIQTLGKSLSRMPKLTFFDITNNYIGLLNANQTNIIAQGLTQKPHLTETAFFPQQNNLISSNFVRFAPIYLTYRHNENLKILSLDALVFFLLNQNLKSQLELNFAGLFDAPSPALMGGFLGYIEQRLGDLRNLKTLNFSSNNFGQSALSVGLFANLFPLLPSLEHFDLSNNFLGLTQVGSIINLSVALPFLSHLKALDLSYNWLGTQGSEGVKALATALHKLTNLEQLNLAHNNLGLVNTDGTTALFTAFSSLRKLKVLNLAENNLGVNSYQAIFALGESFENMPSLRFLNISNNFLGFNFIHSPPANNPFFADLAQLANLQILDLSGNKIGQVQPNNVNNLAKGIRPLGKLRCLFLENNDFSRLPDSKNQVDNLLETLGKLTKLESLRLYGNKITLHTTSSGKLLAKQKSEHIKQECHAYHCFNKSFRAHNPDCRVQSVLGATTTKFIGTSASSRPQPLAIYRHVMTGFQKVAGWAKGLWVMASNDQSQNDIGQGADQIDSFLNKKLKTESASTMVHQNQAAFFVPAQTGNAQILANLSHVATLGS
jgi:Ran GTPase-activating protein (RanGAP) involved in mRNA processing and transport